MRGAAAQIRAKMATVQRQMLAYGNATAKEAVEEIGRAIMKDADPRTPVDTGNLLKSSTFITATDGAGQVKEIQKIKKARRPNCEEFQWEDYGSVIHFVGASNKILALVGYLAPYAHYVHEGTIRMVARPYLGDAAQAIRGSIVGITEKAATKMKAKFRL